MEAEAADQGATMKPEKSSLQKPEKSPGKAQESNKKKDNQPGSQKSEKKKADTAGKGAKQQAAPKGAKQWSESNEEIVASGDEGQQLSKAQLEFIRREKQEAHGAEKNKAKEDKNTAVAQKKEQAVRVPDIVKADVSETQKRVAKKLETQSLRCKDDKLMGKNKPPYLNIPSNWLDCPRNGEILIDKFVPFKTPLDSRYDDDVPEECRFNFDMLLESLRSSRKKMGLVVDLTNTPRYYDSKAVVEKGCRYEKMQCEGHRKPPSQELTEAFIELCAQFIIEKPLEVIGVHCTHGFNRTGFLIISYMIEKLKWSVEDAVQCFAQARPPGIYRQGYLDELFQRYGDVNDIPAAPPLPDW